MRIQTGILCLLLPLLLLALFAAPDLAGAAEKARTVYLIPVNGDVEPTMAAFIERALKEGAGEHNPLYVLELDTFGGRVDSALAIVDSLIADEKRETLAFVTGKAISAGALIALACRRLAMAPGTTIGDCAPISFSEGGVQMLGEKFQSPLRAKFRTLARRNGYPAKLAESMVSPGMEVLRVELPGRVLYLDSAEYEALPEADKKAVLSRKTVIAKDMLLTMDHSEALELGFSSHTSGSVEELLAALGISDYRLVRIEPNWSESLGRLIARASPILLMLGLAALYAEMKAPGFGLPGLVGIGCLGLVFLNQYLVGLADHTELLLMLLGIILLLMEVFVLPGFGLAGIAGICAMSLGLVLSFQDFVLPNPELPWQGRLLTNNLILVLGSLVAAFACAVLFLRHLLPRFGRMVDGPLLATSLGTAGPSIPDTITIGLRGRALTALRPSGKMTAEGIDGPIDVLTEGEFIPQGTPLVVTAVRGGVVKVRKDRS